MRMDPEAISAAVGVYVALRLDSEGANTPAPPLHRPPTAFCTVPAKGMAALLEQACTSAPAAGTGSCWKVTVISSLSGVQLPVEVSVSTTLPKAWSPMLGAY